MNHVDLQRRLSSLGFYHGQIDGRIGPQSKAAILACLTDGPDYPVDTRDIAVAASILRVEEAKVWAVYDVESSGDAFIGGRPTILFEPHRFSKSTDHRFDRSHPALSSRTWNRKLYSRSQGGRWEQLLSAVALDVDAGFMSASYGAFQILGENYAVCGAPDPWSFAWRQAQTEGDQLDAFIRFIEGRGLTGALRRGDWAAFARGYNGTAYRENKYDEKLAAAFARRMK
ncbi:peptidoglycan-binding protein [Sphingobium xenophagum]|uniref:Peptidoglycan-binding protein n=1 Tax=Sphingobium xenophagum TaxID=121428 RepID=A0A249MWM7_SPHXE|nr:N-acetylmuramidase family protein [Sphingobium xenophagum]ASY45771.1 peptidoglycan-binding protein [Sphingobium xenophagum]